MICGTSRVSPLMSVEDSLNCSIMVARLASLVEIVMMTVLETDNSSFRSLEIPEF